MTTRDSLGDRMKAQYEDRTRFMLPRRTYTIMRLDGRAFHRLTRSMERPFDGQFATSMNLLARDLCKEVSGTVFAYVQSDEISLLLQDFESIGTQPWFDGNIQKMSSVAASFAGARFSTLSLMEAQFDCRVFTIPDPIEVANYFIWRQRDCLRNSVSMAAQAYFSTRELHGKNGGEMQEMLLAEKGVDWNEYPDGFKRGRVVSRVSSFMEDGSVREHWEPYPAPDFTCHPGDWLSRRIPVLPNLKGSQ